MLKQFKTFVSSLPDVQKLINHVQEYLNQLTNNVILDGVLVENISVSTSPTQINHGLGREVRGYLLVKSSANVTIYSTTNTTPKSLLTITASGSATISLYIF